MRRLAGTILWLLPAAALAAAAKEPLGFDPEKTPDRAANAYIAPEGLVLFRMRLPDGSWHEFEHDFDRPWALYGAGGWSGRIKGENITVKSGPNLEGGRAEFIFQTGRLVSFKQGKRRLRFPYDAPRTATDGVAPYYFGDEWAAAPNAKQTKKAAAAVKGVFAGKWRRSGRLQWPFRNPNENGCLYASLALLASFFMFMRRRAFKIAGGVMFALALVATAATFSRGAMLALALALLPSFALHARRILKSKAFWAAVVLAALAAGGWLAARGTKMVTRGFGEGSWSNQVRLDMWKAAPAMMAEAPDGWGFAHIGRSYVDWHQPLEVVSLSGSLMNDHLTRLVAWGWKGRWLYVFAWCAAFALLGLAAWRTRDATGLGAAVFLAVAGWFNPVLSRVVFWVAPVLAVALFIASRRPWRGARRLRALCAAALAAVVATAVCGGVYVAGSRLAKQGAPISVQGRRVCVKDPAPTRWIVDDGKALGGILACKEIRGWYRFRPDSPGVGYVRSVKDLPESGVERLVLGGEAGAAWMDRMMKKAQAEGVEAVAWPDTVVFVSPTFPPSALPPEFVEMCNAHIVVGEFAARYEPEYDDPPEWAIVVPGMELYIPGWMDFATSD